MASLELRNKTYRVIFMYGGRKYGYSLDTGDRQTADALIGGVEKTLMLISQGALEVPDGTDVITFVKYGGTVGMVLGGPTRTGLRPVPGKWAGVPQGRRATAVHDVAGNRAAGKGRRQPA